MSFRYNTQPYVSCFNLTYQVRKLGLDLATSNGQPYYPIYLFGPYKLATVAIGCGISFFWVLFPFSITAKSRLRKLLGRSLFALAQFYSCMHATVQLWLNGELDGDLQDELDSGFRVNALRSTRRRLFREEMTLLNALRIHSHFTTFEPAIGGKFPKPVYDEIISETQRILTSMALMAHITQSLNTLSSTPALSQPPGPPQNPNENSTPENKWTTRLASIAMNSPTFNSHSTASLLCHLSAALTNAQPLPPYLSASAGDSFPLARQMQRIDNELLSIRHVWDSGFSAFVALEVLRSVVSFGLRDLVRYVPFPLLPSPSSVFCFAGRLIPMGYGWVANGR